MRKNEWTSKSVMKCVNNQVSKQMSEIMRVNGRMKKCELMIEDLN